MFPQTESSFLGRGSLGRLNRFQRKCPQSEKELVLGAQRHLRSHALEDKGFLTVAGQWGGGEVGDGEGEEAVYHRRRTGLRCAT